MNCQYCNHKLSDLKSLAKHQKQTKYCLEKQKDNEINLLKDEMELLQNQMELKDNEINLLKNQMELLKNEMELLKKFDFNDIQNIIKDYCKN